jgi:hypothetical protein
MVSAAAGKSLTSPLCIWSAWKLNGISQERHQLTRMKAAAGSAVHYEEVKIVPMPQYHAAKVCGGMEVNVHASDGFPRVSVT